MVCPYCENFVEVTSRTVGLGDHIRSAHSVEYATMEARGGMASKVGNAHPFTAPEGGSRTMWPIGELVVGKHIKSVMCAICGKNFTNGTPSSSVGRHYMTCFDAQVKIMEERTKGSQAVGMNPPSSFLESFGL